MDKQYFAKLGQVIAVIVAIFIILNTSSSNVLGQGTPTGEPTNTPTIPSMPTDPPTDTPEPTATDTNIPPSPTLTANETPTSTNTPTVTDIPWTTYPDTQPEIDYRGGIWTVETDSQALQGTTTSTADTDAQMTVRFSGAGIALVYVAHPAGGLFTVQLDQEAPQQINGQALSPLHQTRLEFTNLLDTEHTLVITNQQGTLVVEAIQIQGEILPSGLPPTEIPSPTEDTRLYTFCHVAGNNSSTANYILMENMPYSALMGHFNSDGTPHNGHPLDFIIDGSDIPPTGFTVEDCTPPTTPTATLTDSPTPSATVTNTVTPTATITITPSNTPSNWITYEDTDPLLNYEKGFWDTLQNPEAMGSTLTRTVDQHALFRVYFEGTGIRVIHATGPDGNSFIARLDSQLFQAGTTYSPEASYGNHFGFENLTPGQHSLTFYNGEGALAIEGVQIEGYLVNRSQSTSPSVVSSRSGHGAVRSISYTDGPHFLEDNDDDSIFDPVNIGFPINFYGTAYSQLYVNNNGNVTFGDSSWDYTPISLNQADLPVIAPFFADVDTRDGILDTSTNVVEYGQGTLDNQPVFVVTWREVGCYGQIFHVRNTFQLLLISQANGYIIEFNYDQIEWETGEADFGDENCLSNPPPADPSYPNGFSARVGFAEGAVSPANFYELPGSGIKSALLDTNLQSGLIHNSLNSSQLGRYRWCIPTCEFTKLTVNTQWADAAYNLSFDNSFVGITTGSTSSPNYVEAEVFNNTTGSVNVPIDAILPVQLKMASLPFVLLEHQHHIQVGVKQFSTGTAPNAIEEPPPGDGYFWYWLDEVLLYNGTGIVLPTPDPNDNYTVGLEVALCRDPGWDITDIPVELQTIPLCSLQNTMRLNYTWGDAYGVTLDASEAQISFNGATWQKTIYDGTTGPMNYPTQGINAPASTKLLGITDIPSEYWDEVQVGLYQDTGNAPHSVQAPPETYWYTIADAASISEMYLNLGFPDAQGNYETGITVYLCHDTSGTASTLPATQNASVTLLIFMLSGSFAGLAVVLRHKDRQIPAVVCVLLAIGITVSGGLLLSSGTLDTVGASNFDPNTLPACSQIIPTDTPTATPTQTPLPPSTCIISLQNTRIIVTIYEYPSENDTTFGLPVLVSDYNGTLEILGRYRVKRTNGQDVDWFHVELDNEQIGWVKPNDVIALRQTYPNEICLNREEVPEVGKNGLSICTAENPDTSLWMYRAGVLGNPREHILVANNLRILRFDAYAVDPVNRTLWYRLSGDSIAIIPELAVNTGTSLEFKLRWVQITAFDINQEIEINNIRILPAQTGTLQLTSASLTGILDNNSDITISDCLNRIGNVNFVPANIPWQMPNAFTTFPVTGTDACSSGQSDILGLGADTGIDYKPPNEHLGVDIFVPLESTSSFAYSISNGGIVTGIGISNEEHFSAFRWGGTELSEPAIGYSVIIRYGHLYVLYGHLVTIPENIFVGAQVGAGTPIGIIGLNGHRHIHLEIRNFGTKSNPIIDTESLADTENGLNNQYGILNQVDPKAPENIYDITQFFESTAMSPIGNTNFSGMGIAFDHDSTLNISGAYNCVLIYKTDIPEDPSTGDPGYRGFIFPNATVEAPIHPDVVPTLN